MVNKNSIAGIIIFTVLVQVFPANASSWNPALLVNTETFQTIDDADTASDLYVRFGDSLNKRLTFERTLDRFNFNDDVYVSGDMNVKGTASGKTIFAAEALRSSGSLVWEGSASGASLWVSKFKGAGLISTCDPTTGKLTWDSTAQQFVCGSDAGGSVAPAQGLSQPASGFLSLSTSFSGTSLEIMGTASGRILHGNDKIQGSGSLIVDGAITTKSNINLPTTTTTAGIVKREGTRLLHTFNDNSFFGLNAGNTTMTTAYNNVGIGYYANRALTTGDEDTAVGDYALFGITSGAGNTAIGYNAIATATTASNNTALGKGAGQAATGNSNTFLGYSAGVSQTSGNSNIYVGYFADAVNTTGSNQLNIGNTIYGDLSTDQVGIGTSALDSALEVAGTASGKTLYATESLRSSGSLVWEGSASGASLWVSKFKGAGLISTCDPTTGKLTWDSTAQQFACGTDLNTGTSYAAAQGLSIASNFFRLNTSFSGTALEIMGTSSGRILHGNDKIQGSGTLITDGSISTKTNLTINSDNGAADAVLTFGNDTLAETLTFSRSNSRFEFSDDVYVQNMFEVDGNAQFDGSTLTFGDASGDAVTVNSTTWTFANDTAIGLTGGLNGINFDTNTLSIDGANDRIGIKTAAPDTELEVVGTASGKKIFATDSLASSGNLAIGSLWKRGSGAIAAIPAEYQTGAYLFASGASALALESYTQNLYGTQPLAPSILFGYQGVFDTNLYRTSGSTLRTDDQLLITTTDALNRHAFRIDSEESTSTQDLVEIYSDVSTNENRVFRFRADGNAYADGSWNGGGADLAEWFPTADPGMTPGDLVCLDPKRPLHVKRCNSTKLRIIGIVSTKPGFVGGQEEKLLLEGKTPVLVGLLGQIPTKVTGNVEIGDIIGLSPIDAVGSRLIAPGQSVCTALETHEGPGIGIITCLAPTLQFWTGSIGTE